MKKISQKIKTFQYDTILSADSICNLEEEFARICLGLTRSEKMVIYGRRNSGKTSLVVSKVIPEFKKRFPHSLILMVDLMQVKTLESIDTRFRVAFEQAFSQAFPAKNLLENVKKIFSNLNPTVEIDPLSGTPPEFGGS